MNTFDATVVNSQVDQIWDPVKQLVMGSATGQLLDFNSPSDAAILEKLSDKNNYVCSAASFATDSWVPSVQTPNTVSCKISGGAPITSCTSGNFQAGTCTGCMDSLAILMANSATLGADLAVRYPGCTSFISDLVYTMNNFHGRKGLLYTAGLTGRVTSTEANVVTLKASISTVGTTITNVKNTLSTTADMIMNPTYGIVAGLNCALFGEDINLIIGTTCTQGFKFIFFLRLGFGMAGFGVLFTIWCASCTGVRHYKQS